MSQPFAYPPAPFRRRHGPKGYIDYHSYRPWLRDEFSFRCVYCLLREQWGQARGVHAIDHFLAIAHQPKQRLDYDNLLYACIGCNAVKGGRAIPDPTVLLTAPDLWVSENGAIHATKQEAAKLIERLGLDSPQFTELRMLRIGIIALAAKHDPDLHRRLLGFPENLPNLTRLRPPAGNRRPRGAQNSYFLQRKQGALPATY